MINPKPYRTQMSAKCQILESAYSEEVVSVAGFKLIIG